MMLIPKESKAFGVANKTQQIVSEMASIAG
jgi:hypothetical protein